MARTTARTAPTRAHYAVIGYALLFPVTSSASQVRLVASATANLALSWAQISALVKILTNVTFSANANTIVPTLSVATRVGVCRPGNFGQIIRKNYPVLTAHRVAAEPRESVSVVGPLCTPLDILADKMELGWAEVGDLMVVLQSGAYGYTASPHLFLGHPPPVQVLI